MSCGNQCPGASGAGGSRIPRGPPMQRPQPSRLPTGIPRRPMTNIPRPPPARAPMAPTSGIPRPPSFMAPTRLPMASTSIPRPPARGPMAATGIPRPGMSSLRPAAASTLIPQQPAVAEDLAESVMEIVGEGEVWSEASAVSIQDYQDASGGLQDISPPEMFHESGDSSLGILDASHMQSSFECPCDDDSLGILHDSHYDDSSLGILNESQMPDISMLTENASYISVYDAEELNRTTAPRNDDLNVPRNLLWQNLVATLDETEMIEEEEFSSFLTSLQTERQIFNASF